MAILAVDQKRLGEAYIGTYGNKLRFCITAVLFFGWLHICLSFLFDQVH